MTRIPDIINLSLSSRQGREFYEQVYLALKEAIHKLKKLKKSNGDSVAIRVAENSVNDLFHIKRLLAYELNNLHEKQYPTFTKKNT